MDIEVKQPQLCISTNDISLTNINNVEKSSLIHILPATCKQDISNVQVSNYFTNNMTKNENNYEVSLLGHTLIGREVELRNTYQCFFSKDGEILSLDVLRKVGEVIEWRKDRAWKDCEGPTQTIEKYIDIQNILHGFVEQ